MIDNFFEQYWTYLQKYSYFIGDVSYISGSMKVYYYDGKVYNGLNEEI